MTRKDTGSPRTYGPALGGTPGVSYTGRGVHRIAVEALARRIFDGTYAEGTSSICRDSWPNWTSARPCCARRSRC